MLASAWLLGIWEIVWSQCLRILKITRKILCVNTAISFSIKGPQPTRFSSIIMIPQILEVTLSSPVSHSPVWILKANNLSKVIKPQVVYISVLFPFFGISTTLTIAKFTLSDNHFSWYHQTQWVVALNYSLGKWLMIISHASIKEAIFWEALWQHSSIFRDFIIYLADITFKDRRKPVPSHMFWELYFWTGQMRTFWHPGETIQD